MSRVREQCFALSAGEWLLIPLDDDSIPHRPATPPVRRWRGDASSFCEWPDASIAIDHDAIAAEIRRLLRSASGKARERLHEALSLLQPGLRMAPLAAARLDADHLLLSFAALASPAVLRVLRCSDGECRAECTAESLFLDTRPERQFFPGVPVVEVAELQSARDGLALISFRGQRGLVQWSDGALSLRWQIDNDGSPAQLLDGALVHGSVDGVRPVLTLRRLEDRSALADYQTDHPGRYVDLRSAPTGSRFAISHEGGIVEIVDSAERRTLACRPDPRSGVHARLRLDYAPDARHLLACSDAGAWVIDPVGALRANLPDVGPWWIGYDDCIAPGDGTLRRVAWADLQWQPLARLDATDAQAAPADLERDGLLLLPSAYHAPDCAHNSWLYGQCRLPPGHYWPRHDGQAMALLAQLDCKDLCKAGGPADWPAQGLVLVFLALDADHALIQDAELRPRIHVEYLENTDACTRSSAAPVLAPAQPLRLCVDRAQLPMPDSLQVEMLNWSPQTLEAYRGHLRQRPRPSAPVHRAGGYPTRLRDGALEREAAQLAQSSEPERWQLLLQFDSDRHCHWGGGAGLLFLYIHAADFARRDFRRVVALVEAD